MIQSHLITFEILQWIAIPEVDFLVICVPYWGISSHCIKKFLNNIMLVSETFDDLCLMNDFRFCLKNIMVTGNIYIYALNKSQTCIKILFLVGNISLSRYTTRQKEIFCQIQQMLTVVFPLRCIVSNKCFK